MSDLSADMANLSIASGSGSSSSHIEDWDTSFTSSSNASSTAASPHHRSIGLPVNVSTPRNSVAFPGNGDADVHTTPGGGHRDKRSLSELLRLHAEKGTTAKFSPEEAARIAEVLGNWINTSTSPYEGEDDFFQRAQDDSSPSLLQGQRSVSSSSTRPRGQSEGTGLSRPGSSNGS